MMFKGFFNFFRKKPKATVPVLALPQLDDDITVKENVQDFAVPLPAKTAMAAELSALTTSHVMTPEELSVIEREKVRLINRRLGKMTDDAGLEEAKQAMRQRAIRERAAKEKNNIVQAKINAEIAMKNLENEVLHDASKFSRKVLGQVDATQEETLAKARNMAHDFATRSTKAIKELEDVHAHHLAEAKRVAESFTEQEAALVADAEKRQRKLLARIETLKKAQVADAEKLEADFLRDEESRFKKIFEARDKIYRKLEAKWALDREPGLRAAIKGFVDIGNESVVQAVIDYLNNPSRMGLAKDSDQKANVVRGIQKEIAVNLLKRVAALEGKE